MNTMQLQPGWNTVTDQNSVWFGLQVWVHDFDVFPPQNGFVSVMTSDDAPTRQFHVSMFG